jgi:hypothetical protein
MTGVKAAIAIALGVATTYGFASGPPFGHTGAPGEQTCVECHTGTLNSGAGRVTISGVPDKYVPGTEYTLTVKVEHPDRQRWGFQLTALDGASKPVGAFTLVDRSTTRTVSGNGTLTGRKYVEHTSLGTFEGKPGSASWDVKWTAPATDAGRVTFYAAGNAANGNNQSSGDLIYTTSVSSGTSTPTIIAPTYKKGKIVLQANGSNIEPGAVLEVSGPTITGTETFPLAANATNTKWQVKKTTTSSPSGKTVDELIAAGATVTLTVRNPDGVTSAPMPLSR